MIWCSGFPSDQSSHSNRGCTRGKSRHNRRVSPGPGKASRVPPSRNTVPRCLHSTQTLWAGVFGLRPCKKRANHFHQLMLVDGAAAQLKINPHVIGDRRGLVESVDVGRRSVDNGDEFLTSLKFRSAWMPPAVAQAPMVTRSFETPPHLMNALGIMRRRDRALDQR